MSETKTSELEARLAKVKADRAALQAARDKAAEQRLLEEQVVAEEQAFKDEQAVADAEAEHGTVGKKIAVVSTDMGVIVLKRSNPLIFKRFQDVGSTKSADLDKLVRPCLVYPDIATFDRILEELPATMLRLASAVAGLAGVRAEEVSGK